MSELEYADAKTTRQGQVTRELERQLRAVEELHTALGELEERTIVIRTPQPQPGADPRPEAIRAGLAQAIGERADGIENATRRVRAMLAELEL